MNRKMLRYHSARNMWTLNAPLCRFPNRHWYCQFVFPYCFRKWLCVPILSLTYFMSPLPFTFVCPLAHDTVSDPGVCFTDFKAKFYFNTLLHNRQSLALPEGRRRAYFLNYPCKIILQFIKYYCTFSAVMNVRPRMCQNYSLCQNNCVMFSKPLSFSEFEAFHPLVYSVE